MLLALGIKLGYTLSLMRSRTHKFLLIIVALVLAVSPLRGALALQVMTVADEPTHCQQIHDGMQYVAVENQDHRCEQDCGGDCCDGACNACTHGSIAVSGPITVTPDNHESHLNSLVSYGVPGRTVHPPFRPPISLHS